MKDSELKYVYVAGSSRELDRVRRVQQAVSASGSLRCVADGDWTRFIDAQRAGTLDKTERQCALANVCAIDHSDIVIAVWPLSATSKGMCFEIGWALAKDKPVVIWDQGESMQPGDFIFAHLPGVAVYNRSAPDEMVWYVASYFVPYYEWHRNRRMKL